MQNQKGQMSVQDAGRKGGERTKETHDHNFYQQIGRKGGETTSREHGPEFYEQIGHKGGQRVRELINEGKESEK